MPISQPRSLPLPRPGVGARSPLLRAALSACASACLGLLTPDAARAQSVSATAPKLPTAPAVVRIAGSGFTTAPYQVDFGDPFACIGDERVTVTSLATPVRHTYRARGVFRPAITDATPLTAFATTPVTLTSGNQAPGAAASLSDATLFAGDIATLALSATDSDGTVRQCWVDWGDGTPLELVSTASGCPSSASHTYTASGRFAVTLQVQDDLLACRRASTPVNVYPVADWRYLGPGATGKFQDIAVHPTDDAILLAASDVTGLFLSRDAGASWINPAEGFLTQDIFAVTFAEESATDVVAYAATERAVYKSDVNDFTAWRMLETGLDDATPGTNGFDHRMSAVTVDPTDSNIVWAAVGCPKPRETNTENEISSPHHVSVSTDAGETWSGSLALPDLDGDATNGGEGGVYDLLVHPTDGDRVWVATTVGLFHTFDGGTTWYEYGVLDPRASTAGAVWTTTTAFTACANTPATGAALAATTDYCLPLTTTETGYTDRPQVTDLDYGWSGTTFVLLVNIQDMGNAPSDPECAGATSGSYVDSDLSHFRGGAWASEDDGLTFRWRLIDASSTPKLTSLHYRCGGTDWQKATNFVKLDADPDDPEHLFAIAEANKKESIYELTSTSASNWWCDDSAGACDEGTAIAPNLGVPVNLRVTDWTSSHPSLYVMNSGGIAALTWDGSLASTSTAATALGGWYAFDHLEANVVALGTASYDTRWQSTGLDDTISGRLVVDPTDDQRLFLGVGDAGVYRSTDGGATWEHVSGYWGDVIATDVTNNNTFGLAFDVIADDTRTPILYATTSEPKRSDPYMHVYRTGDRGDTWELIGTTEKSLTTTTGATAGWIDADSEITDLTTYATSGGLHRVILATSLDGLLEADPDSSPVTWSAVSGTDCPSVGASYTDHNGITETLKSVAVTHVEVLKDLPDLVFFDATVKGSAVVAEATLFAYAPDLGSCVRFASTLTVDGTTEKIARVDGFDVKVWHNTLRVVMGVDWVAYTHLVETTLVASTLTMTTADVMTGASGITWSSVLALSDTAADDAAAWCSATYGALCDATLTKALEDELYLAYKKMEFQGVHFVPGFPGFSDAVIATVRATPSFDYYQPPHAFIRLGSGEAFTAWDAHDVAGVPVKNAWDLTFSPTGETLYWLGTGGLYATAFLSTPASAP